MQCFGGGRGRPNDHLLPVLERLRPNLEKYLKPGARVVSNEFPVKGWNPREVVEMKTGGMTRHIYVYEIGRQ